MEIFLSFLPLPCSHGLWMPLNHKFITPWPAHIHIHVCIYYVAELQILPLELTFTKEFIITSLISRKNFSLALKYFIPHSHRTHCSQFISCKFLKINIMHKAEKINTYSKIQNFIFTFKRCRILKMHNIEQFHFILNYFKDFFMDQKIIVKSIILIL